MEGVAKSCTRSHAPAVIARRAASGLALSPALILERHDALRLTQSAGKAPAAGAAAGSRHKLALVCRSPGPALARLLLIYTV